MLCDVNYRVPKGVLQQIGRKKTHQGFMFTFYNNPGLGPASTRPVFTLIGMQSSMLYFIKASCLIKGPIIESSAS